MIINDLHRMTGQILRRLQRLEKPSSNARFANVKSTSAQISGNGTTIYIDAPPGTIIDTTCWINGDTKLDEHWEMGSDQMVGTINNLARSIEILDNLEGK